MTFFGGRHYITSGAQFEDYLLSIGLNQTSPDTYVSSWIVVTIYVDDIAVTELNTEQTESEQRPSLIEDITINRMAQTILYG